MKPVSAIPRHVDWTLRDVDLSRKYGVTRERCRQVREERGAPRSSYHFLRGPSVLFSAWVQQHRHLSGLLSIKEVIEESEIPILTHTARARCRRLGFRIMPYVYLRWYQKIPVNLDLPNGDLEKIWGLHYNTVANSRSRYGLRSARWDARKPLNSAAYLKAIATEKRRAAAYNAS